MLEFLGMEQSKDLLQPLQTTDDIRAKIYTIRGVQVMLDSDLAEIYGYETKNFNRQVRNNIEKFDEEDFMFQLNQEDIKELSRCKNFTLNRGVGRGSNIKYLPYVFTEQGIYMLMTVLKGELAVKQSKMLIRMFKQMRQYIAEHELLSEHLTKIDLKLLEHDKAIGQVLKQLEEPRAKKAILFFKGQMFDAFSCIAYFNKQYAGLTVHYTTEFHDRFMIIDRKTLYHIGASIKDAGKKAFEISQIDDDKQVSEILKRL